MYEATRNSLRKRRPRKYDISLQRKRLGCGQLKGSECTCVFVGGCCVANRGSTRVNLFVLNTINAFPQYALNRGTCIQLEIHLRNGACIRLCLRRAFLLICQPAVVYEVLLMAGTIKPVKGRVGCLLLCPTAHLNF